MKSWPFLKGSAADHVGSARGSRTKNHLLAALAVGGSALLATAGSSAAPVTLPDPSIPLLPERPSLCRMQEVARLPLRLTGYSLTTPALLDGGPLSMIVDTGSQGGLLTPEAAMRFHLVPDPQARVVIAGPDGRGHEVPVMLVPSLQLEHLRLTDVGFPLGNLPGVPKIRPPVQGLLGMNVLGIFDVELDLPHHQLNLWDVRRGSAICPSPPPWPGRVGAGWTELPARVSGGRFFIPFTLDGRRGVALLDSGARSHILSRGFAHRLGVSADVLARDPGGVSGGVNTASTTNEAADPARALNEANVYRWHRFHRLSVAGQTRLDPVLTVAPLHDQADLLLGADWFATHRVWLSTDTPNGEGRIYVQDVPQFQPAPAVVPLHKARKRPDRLSQHRHTRP
ncbi:hypothetical protein E3203_06905 [Oecophyllibacter saccharovorans]|nr:hypothetical protein E3203_06905 [Oecophyllibacter saccharovorans]